MISGSRSSNGPRALGFVATAGGWEAVTEGLRAAYERPEAAADDLDQDVRDGWLVLYQALADDWDARFEEAQRLH
jgi:hypothetical protein